MWREGGQECPLPFLVRGLPCGALAPSACRDKLLPAASFVHGLSQEWGLSQGLLLASEASASWR